MSSLADLRKEYSRATLDVNSVTPGPIAQFEKWFAEATEVQVPQPNAMNLSTISRLGRPTSRMVLLKGIENECFVFYSNHQSQKGLDLENNPACALSFFWPDMERQVRIEGIATRVSEEKSIAYFQSRPRASQISAWASPQSAVISDRTILEQRAAEIDKKFAGQPSLPKPKQWGGYQVEPWVVEFWQGRTNCLHDRIVYTKSETGWKKNRLAP